MRLNGQTAVVTGASRGIGRAVALRLAGHGANVVVNYSSSRDEAEAVVREIADGGGSALAWPADVGSDEQVRAMFAGVGERWQPVSVLVNNAGTTDYVPHSNFSALTDEMWRRTLDVNLLGTWHCAKWMAEFRDPDTDGCIVNIASVAGLLGTGSSIAYAASKGAVLTLTRSLARVLAPRVRVNAVAAGMVDTTWWDNLNSEFAMPRDAQAERYERNSPLGRVGTAEEIADAVDWLVTGADLTTGTTIVADSGIHLGNA